MDDWSAVTFGDTALYENVFCSAHPVVAAASKAEKVGSKQVRVCVS